MLLTDRKAVEGMPLKLLIVALLISISFPYVWQALTYYDTTVMVEEAAVEANQIKAAATSAYLGGEGNVRNIHVRLRPSMTGLSPAIEIGGPPGSSLSRTIRVLTDHGPVCTVPLDDPAIEIRTLTEDQVRLEKGDTELVLRAIRSIGILAIYVEVR
jgi:hypothetical protein